MQPQEALYAAILIIGLPQCHTCSSAVSTEAKETAGRKRNWEKEKWKEASEGNQYYPLMDDRKEGDIAEVSPIIMQSGLSAALLQPRCHL